MQESGGYMAFEKTLARLKRYKDQTRLQQGFMIVVKEAQRRCPVDTGYLRDNWILKNSRGVWSIAFTADYAIYVHERLDVKHDVGEAKFLENAWHAKIQEFIKFIMS